MKNGFLRTVKFLLGRLFCPHKMPGEKGRNGVGKRARNNTSGISAFRFGYDGSIGGNNYTYVVSQKDESVVFSYNSMEYPDLEHTEMTVDKSVLDRLNELYVNFRLAEWDGYSKYNTEICDGDGFSLRIKFNDGASVAASGTNAFPRRYGEFFAAMSSILDPLRDELLASNGEK